MARRPQKKSIAAALNVSPSRVTALVKAGMPVDSIAAASSWFETHIRPTDTARRRGRVESGELPAARARRQAALARLREIDLACERGELVPRADVERRAYAAGRSINRQFVDTLPAILAAEAVVITDPATFAAWLSDRFAPAMADALSN